MKASKSKPALCVGRSSLSAVLAAILMLSPLPAVLRAKKIQHLEYLNPLPFPGTLAVGTAFLGYALVLVSSLCQDRAPAPRPPTRTHT